MKPVGVTHGLVCLAVWLSGRKWLEEPLRHEHAVPLIRLSRRTISLVQTHEGLAKSDVPQTLPNHRSRCSVDCQSLGFVALVACDLRRNSFCTHPAVGVLLASAETDTVFMQRNDELLKKHTTLLFCHCLFCYPRIVYIIMIIIICQYLSNSS